MFQALTRHRDCQLSLFVCHMLKNTQNRELSDHAFDNGVYVVSRHVGACLLCVTWRVYFCVLCCAMCCLCHEINQTAQLRPTVSWLCTAVLQKTSSTVPVPYRSLVQTFLKSNLTQDDVGNIWKLQMKQCRCRFRLHCIVVRALFLV